MLSLANFVLCFRSFEQKINNDKNAISIIILRPIYLQPYLSEILLTPSSRRDALPLPGHFVRFIGIHWTHSCTTIVRKCLTFNKNILSRLANNIIFINTARFNYCTARSIVFTGNDIITVTAIYNISKA